MLKYYKFLAHLKIAFQICAECNLSDFLFNELEEYVCNLHGCHEKNNSKLRWLLFQKKHAKENKVTDLSALPPCHDALQINSEKANFVAKVLKSSLKRNIDKENFANHGRAEYADICLIYQPLVV